MAFRGSHRRAARLWLKGALLSLPLLSGPIIASPESGSLLKRLGEAAPQLRQKVLARALEATRCAVRKDLGDAERLAVIDFSLPSSRQRLWVFDLRRGALLLRDFVAHGRRSGENHATRFSNRLGSHQSSLGLFRGSEPYRGKHGYSLRMDGLEPGINDNARERAIVIHGASYVNPDWIERQGRIGRSLGCPSVRPEVAREVVNQLKNGQFVFSWYPDPAWQRQSKLLNCEAREQVADTDAIPPSGTGS